jgi:3-oxoacyl-[acyl-carrier protein] reductase
VFDTDRIKTMLQTTSQKTGQSVEALADARRKNIPAQRFGTPEEFGAICAFLCSVQAAYMTGQNVLADGGAYPGTY